MGAAGQRSKEKARMAGRPGKPNNVPSVGGREAQMDKAARGGALNRGL
jgi:hypothetical protein